MMKNRVTPEAKILLKEALEWHLKKKPRNTQIFFMYHAHGATLKEVAKEFGITASTVYIILAKVRRQLCYYMNKIGRVNSFHELAA